MPATTDHPLTVPAPGLGSASPSGPVPEAVRLRSATDQPTVLLDARWWQVGGTGAVTRSLVRGLADLHPEHRWVLWGPDAVADAAWPGAVHVSAGDRPAAWFGQRQAFRVPPADLVVHLHQTRPAHRRPAASCILDLIQLRHPNPVVRRALHRRLALTIGHADVLFTIAPSVRDEVSATFDVDRARIRVLHLPVDHAVARSIAQRRAAEDARLDPEDRRALVAVGGFRPHKNHRRLIEAFAATRFAATGGRLHLVGGTLDELGLTASDLPHGVRVLGRLGDAALQEELVAALALVQPSLVEGYGLPVAEALAAKVPVVSSPVPAVTEFGPAGVPTFDPRSVTDMAEAIDATAALAVDGRYWQRVDRDAWLADQPEDIDLAAEVAAGIAPALVGR